MFDPFLLTKPTSLASEANGYVAALLPRRSLLNAPQIKFSACSVT
jgi:hypothetical protein